MSHGVRIGDFKAAFLQVFAEIEHGTADEKRALWIDNEANVLRWHQNIPLLRAIYQIHDVLQAGAAAANHLEAQRTVWLSFFFQQRR